MRVALRRVPVSLMMSTRAFLAACLVAGPGALGAAQFYVGAGLGEEIEGGAFEEPLAAAGNAEDLSRRLFAGAEISRHLGLEIAYHDLGTRTCCPNLADLGFVTELDGWAAALVGRREFDRLQVFVKAGVLLWSEEGEEVTIAGPRPLSADGSDPLLGLGFWWPLAGRLLLGAQWEFVELSGSASDALSISARIDL